MPERGDRIRWDPKVSRAKIWQLYQTDARGIVDEALVDEVGLALLARCRSVLMVSSGQVECPRCRRVFACIAPPTTPPVPDSHVISCPSPGCSWQTTFGQYHNSWRHQDLIGNNAFPAFETFVERYELTASPRERMVLIDQMIHAFHWNLKFPVPHRPAANNLIEGSVKDLVAFLDRLTYGEASTPGIEETRSGWRETVREMERLRHPGARAE